MCAQFEDYTQERLQDDKQIRKLTVEKIGIILFLVLHKNSYKPFPEAGGISTSTLGS